MNKELEKALDKAIKMHDDVIKTYCGMNKKYKSTAAKKAFEAVLFHAKANKRQLEQLKGVDVGEEFARAVADMEGDLFVDLEIPAHLPGVAHPFRMGRGLLRRDADMAGGVRLAACAVGSGNGIGRVFVHRHVLPGEEAVELAVVLAPEADVDHQIGRQSPPLFRLTLVPDYDGLVRGLFGIAGKEFHIKGLLLAGALVYGRKGVPPPVIALFCQRSAKHPLISRDIALV